MDQTPPSNVIPFPRRRRAVAIPPSAPPQAQPPSGVRPDFDLGLTRFGAHVLVTTPGVVLDDEVILAPAIPPSDARLIAERLLISARVAECPTCSARLVDAAEGEVFSANAVGLCAECSA